jgi:hypothetical protein
MVNYLKPVGTYKSHRTSQELGILFRTRLNRTEPVDINIIHTEPVKKFIKHTHPVENNINHTEPVKSNTNNNEPVDSYKLHIEPVKELFRMKKRHI